MHSEFPLSLDARNRACLYCTYVGVVVHILPDLTVNTEVILLLSWFPELVQSSTDFTSLNVLAKP